MSSLVRRIQRQLYPSQKIHPTLDVEGNQKQDDEGNQIYHQNPPRRKFYGKDIFNQGRGAMLGFKRPTTKEGNK